METSTGPVYSLPIEEVLLADCAGLVQDCAVIGVPSADGARPVAAVRLQKSVQEPSSAALLERLNQALTTAQLTPLAGVIIVRNNADYPTGVTGKVLKRTLRTRLAGFLNETARTQSVGSAAE
jgi:acyl-CoA synthetase (AMP-forming)/AMP-acid ligase II